jgi:hypothetical protein
MRGVPCNPTIQLAGKGAVVPFNRIGGFYIGHFLKEEIRAMTLEEKNEAVNAAVDVRLGQLNAAIEAHEKALKGMKVARDVCYTYDRTFYSSYEESQIIAFIKWIGQWRLCYGAASFDGQEPPEISWKPLVNATIVERMEAMSHIEELKEAVIKDKEKLVGEMERIVESAVEALSNYPAEKKKK